VTKFNLQQIDESLLEEHSLLMPEDRCYFFGDYAGKQGFSHSPMNNMMHNFKKPVDRKNKLDEWQYKEKAIRDIADLLISIRQWEKLRSYTWIPMPSSKSYTDQRYDDRLMKVFNLIKEKEKNLDVRELLKIQLSRPSLHEPGNRRLSVEEHMKNLTFDESQKNPVPQNIVIFDDVITTGASFKAAQTILQRSYPTVRIVGIFIARSVRSKNSEEK
jgi:predicted amidophosphoribosyltransferase